MKDWQVRLTQILDSFLEAARPVVARDPSIFDLAYADQSLRRIIGLSSQSSAESLFYNAISGYAQAINRLFGSNLTTPGPQVNLATQAGPLYALTPEQIEAVPGQQGVTVTDTGEQVILYEEPQGAEDEPVPTSPQLVVDPVEQFVPVAVSPNVTGDSPPPLPQANVAAGSQPVGTFTDVTVAYKANPIETTPVMATGNIDPAYQATYSGGLPVGVNYSLGDSLLGGLAAGFGALAGGSNVGTAILGGLQGAGVLPTPGIAGPTNGNGQDGNVLNQLLQLLGSIPGGQVPAAVIGGAQKLIGNGTQAPATGQMQIPLNGALAQTGLPMAPVMQATPTTTYRAPKGYVVVDLVGSNGVPTKVAMWKPMARSLKLWKARPKPPIKASEWKALKTAERVSKKAKTIAQKAGYSCRQR